MKKVLAGLAAVALLVSASNMPAVAQEPIRLGIALSQTGNLADSASHYFKGIELWRDQVNARGGLLGRKVEFVVYDERSDPATAARLYERLITNDKVDLLVSPMGSASTATGTAIAEKHKRIMINAGGASEKIQQRGFKYIFQTAARISAYVEGVDPLMKKHSIKTMAFVSRDYSAARDMEVTLKEMASRNGVQIVMAEYFPAGTADFSSQIARARQLNPDLWISVGYPNEAIEMIRQFRAVNYMPKVFIHNGVSQEDFITAAGKDGEFALGMSLYETSVKTKGNDNFVKEFKAKFNYEPGYYAGFGYAGVTVLEEAIKKAGSLDQDAIRDVLTKLETETVLGHHKVDPQTGLQLGVKGLLVQVRDGKREVVWPDEVRTAEPRIPLPNWNQR
jgi:branched-chain amino acid transport system substrate-binding protein